MVEFLERNLDKENYGNILSIIRKHSKAQSSPY